MPDAIDPELLSRPPAEETAVQKASVRENPADKPAVSTAAAKQVAAKKAAAKKAAVKKGAVKKAAVKKAAVKEAATKTSPTSTAPAKKAASRKAAANQAAANPASANSASARWRTPVAPGLELPPDRPVPTGPATAGTPLGGIGDRIRSWRDADPAGIESQARIRRLTRVALALFVLAVCGFLIDGANRPANPHLMPAPAHSSPAPASTSGS